MKRRNNKMIRFLFSLVLVSSCKSIKPSDKVSTIGTDNGKTIKINSPIIKDKYTTVPAALVYNDKVDLYTGHDETPNDFNFIK